MPGHRDQSQAQLDGRHRRPVGPVRSARRSRPCAFGQRPRVHCEGGARLVHACRMGDGSGPSRLALVAFRSTAGRVMQTAVAAHSRPARRSCGRWETLNHRRSRAAKPLVTTSAQSQERPSTRAWSWKRSRSCPRTSARGVDRARAGERVSARKSSYRMGRT